MSEFTDPTLRFGSEQRKQAIQKLEEADALLKDHYQFYTTEERQRLRKMGDKTTVFVSKSIEYGRRYDGVLPRLLDVDQLERDYLEALEMDRVIRKLEMMVEGMKDARLKSADKALTAAYKVYQAIRGAGDYDLPGLKSAVDDLGKRFHNPAPQRNTQKDPFPEANSLKRTGKMNGEEVPPVEAETPDADKE